MTKWKAKAIAQHLKIDLTEVEDGFDVDNFEVDGEEYMVLTDKEADAKAREYILDSVWAFNPDFLAAHTREGIDSDVIKAIQDNDKCEDNNRALTALIEDLDSFVEDATASDGRGHFLKTYDGEENEISVDGKLFYIYRIN